MQLETKRVCSFSEKLLCPFQEQKPKATLSHTDSSEETLNEQERRCAAETPAYPQFPLTPSELWVERRDEGDMGLTHRQQSCDQRRTEKGGKQGFSTFDMTAELINLLLFKNIKIKQMKK